MRVSINKKMGTFALAGNIEELRRVWIDRVQHQILDALDDDASSITHYETGMPDLHIEIVQ